MKSPVLAALALALGLGLGTAQAEMLNPNTYPQPKDGSDFLTVIEIPQGSFTKYELDHEQGYIYVDRFQQMPVAYPANYGSIPSTIGADGDPLDALVMAREPIVPGAVIKVRAIGVLHMVDGGEQDDKIIAVPVSKVDPTYDGIKTITDLPEMERNRIEAFFRVYKQLPAGRKAVELKGYSDAAAANDLVAQAIAAYRAKTK